MINDSYDDDDVMINDSYDEDDVMINDSYDDDDMMINKHKKTKKKGSYLFRLLLE
jgi:hypothetical protein